MNEFNNIFCAIKKGNIDYVMLFLKNGGDVNTKNIYQESLLYIACFWCQIEISKSYISGEYLFIRHKEIIKLLVNWGADKISVDNFYYPEIKNLVY